MPPRLLRCVAPHVLLVVLGVGVAVMAWATTGWRSAVLLPQARVDAGGRLVEPRSRERAAQPSGCLCCAWPGHLDHLHGVDGPRGEERWMGGGSAGRAVAI